MASCAIAEPANAIKAAATKNFFMLTSSQMLCGVPSQTTRVCCLPHRKIQTEALPMTASGQKLTNHRGPKSTVVRCCSNSGQILQRSEMTRCAKSGLMHRSKVGEIQWGILRLGDTIQAVGDRHRST